MIDGILLLDKPLGLSSNAATQRVRRLLGGVKAGHVGSLDPLATGMLPICLGEATKLAGEVLEGNKVYRFAVRLGARTATGDAEGAIVETAPVPTLEGATVDRVLERFLGDSEQIPPMYSAIKQGGQPLYALARAGKTVERAARRIRIHALERLTLEPAMLECRVECGKGTYVRVLAEDIARALGTQGHVVALRRECVQPFPSAGMQTLPELESLIGAGHSPPVLEPQAAVPHLPAVELGAEAARRLALGQVVDFPGLAAPEGQILRVLEVGGRFLGLGRVAGPERIAPKRLVAQRPSA